MTDVWKVKVTLLFVHFVLQYHVYHLSVLLMSLFSPGGPPLLLGQLFVKRSIRLMSLLFTENTISFWFPMVQPALILSLNLLSCMRALALPLLWNVSLWKLPWCYLFSFSRSLTCDPSLVKMSSVLNAVCISGMRVILIICLLKSTPSSGIYNILITPLQLTALAYLLAWSSKERLNLLCGSSQNRLGAHFCLSPLRIGESTVFDELVKKHPDPSPVTPLSLINPGTTDLQSCHTVIFDCLDGGLIRRTAVRIEGFAGPSGVDALGWKRLCTSFRTASSDLFPSLALVAKALVAKDVSLHHSLIRRPQLQPLLS